MIRKSLNNPKALSIIVCCHREPVDMVRFAVSALRDSGGVSQHIILCANGPIHYGELMESKLVDEYVHLKTNGGVAQLRNAGLARGFAPLVLFLDGHMVIENWATAAPAILEIFARDSSIGFVTGVYGSAESRLGDQARNLIYVAFAEKAQLKRTETTKNRWLTCSGGITVQRTELLNELDGLSTLFAGASCEDLFVQLREEQRGSFLAVCPAFRGVHIHPMGLGTFYRTCLLRNGKGEAILFLCMLFGLCKRRFRGYVCEIPYWYASLSAAVAVSLLYNPDSFVAPVLILITLALMLRWLWPAISRGGLHQVTLHAVLGYAGEKVAKVIWIPLVLPTVVRHWMTTARRRVL